MEANMRSMDPDFAPELDHSDFENDTEKQAQDLYDSEFATDDLETDSQASPVVDDDASDDIDDDGNEGSDSVNLLNRSYSPRNSETDNFRLYLSDMGQYKVLSQKEETELWRAWGESEIVQYRYNGLGDKDKMKQGVHRASEAPCTRNC